MQHRQSVSHADPKLEIIDARQRIRIRFEDGGVTLTPAGRPSTRWVWSVRLVGVGGVASSLWLETQRPVVARGRLEYRHPGVTEWILNEPEGMEHGFDVLEPIDSEASEVELRLALGGSLLPSVGPDGRGLSLRDPHGRILLHYDGLQAFDRTGRQLAASMALDRAQLLRIRVDVAGAFYPVVVN